MLDYMRYCLGIVIYLTNVHSVLSCTTVCPSFNLTKPNSTASHPTSHPSSHHHLLSASVPQDLTAPPISLSIMFNKVQYDTTH